ncbi:unnamed protein product [Rotaria sp. Silwood1]|nr:unnamed protein product [Rotaria sp. Silwood1]
MHSETFIIVDDEKCFTFSGIDMPGNARFYSSDRENTPPDVEYKSKQKFEPKILLWLAIASKGISAPFIGTAEEPAVDADVYIGKCLPKLIRFINEYHIDDKYVFCAICAKHVNPPNVPKARPIEDFWETLAQQVYIGGWAAMNQEQLIKESKHN